MKKYYSNPIGTDFKASLPRLRKKIRAESFDPNDSIYGIAGNTFRAFRGFKKPSRTYRSWARSITENAIKNQDGFDSQDDLDKWHIELYSTLKNHWKKEQDNEPSFAHTYKMVDLYLKWLCSNEKCPEKLANSIIKYGYCALDSQILKKLNEALSYALPIRIRNPSMGDITNENTYEYCQSLIKDFAENFNGYRLLFDYYAWVPGSAKK
ncbi:MAG: hypothetical protein A2W77_02800 [Nitrospinae bacterium RIFCSPLOWO2_12_39_16]|nr:MAG: hypothetical protein A2Z59_14090 [Nitrospinae bacterium RIFCSPLOWO2_02_39_17]OGW12904.1 MAG: hypothetical protein A2W77_02800 [Nitrospinae bacterium RIFCSPLOWO2_12_39_16]